jgi:uncharacterized membrane protein
MNDFLERAFSFLCGQDPAHTWAPSGAPLPFCERCTGLYVGAAIAMLLLILCKPVLDARFRWLHAALLVLMAPFGFHLVPQGPVLRTMSGYWFAFGIVGLLRLGARRHPVSTPGPGGSTRHLLLGLCSLVLLPVFAIWGGALASTILPWAGLAGLLVYAVLVAANGYGLFQVIRDLQSVAVKQVPKLP